MSNKKNGKIRIGSPMKRGILIGGIIVLFIVAGMINYYYPTENQIHQHYLSQVKKSAQVCGELLSKANRWQKDPHLYTKDYILRSSQEAASIVRAESLRIGQMRVPDNLYGAHEDFLRGLSNMEQFFEKFGAAFDLRDKGNIAEATQMLENANERLYWCKSNIDSAARSMGF